MRTLSPQSRGDRRVKLLSLYGQRSNSQVFVKVFNFIGLHKNRFLGQQIWHERSYETGLIWIP
jgi:hypothetical protein